MVEVPEERGNEEVGGEEEDEGEEGEEREEEGEVGEVVARTPVARQRPRLQSHGTPAGGTIVDLPVRSGIVSRYLF